MARSLEVNDPVVLDNVRTPTGEVLPSGTDYIAGGKSPIGRVVKVRCGKAKAMIMVEWPDKERYQYYPFNLRLSEDGPPEKEERPSKKKERAKSDNELRVKDRVILHNADQWHPEIGVDDNLPNLLWNKARVRGTVIDISYHPQADAVTYIVLWDNGMKIRILEENVRKLDCIMEDSPTITKCDATVVKKLLEDNRDIFPAEMIDPIIDSIVKVKRGKSNKRK